MRVEWMSHSHDEHNLFNRHEIVVDCIVTGRVLQYWSSLSLHLFFCIIWMPIQNIKYVNVYLMNFSLLLCVYQKRFRPGTWKNSPSTKMQTLWLPCIAVLRVDLNTFTNWSLSQIFDKNMLLLPCFYLKRIECSLTTFLQKYTTGQTRSDIGKW